MKRKPRLATPFVCAAMLASAAIAFSSTSSLAGTVIRVNGQTGSDANDGQDWTTAKKTVTAALAAAQSDDQVWVAAGTYVENITLKESVQLYGGFAGNETELMQRDWTANQTILDGNQAGGVVIAPEGATETTRIDGFTIRNGIGTSDSGRLHGGGIHCCSSSPVISNNTITGNTAHEGGGIYCSVSSSPVIAENAIVGNRAYSGAGIYCRDSSATISNNTIRGNRASVNGGALWCGYGSPMMVGNTILGNVGTGIYCIGANPTIVNNTIMGNSDPGIWFYSSSPTIANTIIAFNSSGIQCYATGSRPMLRSNCVYGNGAYEYSGIADPTGTNGNISADPRLPNPEYGGKHLQPGSPCIDAGDDSVVQAGSLDMDGQARIQGSHVDIGADESDGTAWPATGPKLIVRVAPDGNDANDGASWAAAKRTVQAGIDTASALGGEVWVRTGTYLERITLCPFAHIYAGFGGTEAARNQRDARANVTILDGQLGGWVVYAESAVSGFGTIDGFTIMNGNGGIWCPASSTTIANNVITANTRSAIICSSGSPRIVNNAITANRGSAIECSSASPTIVNNTIAANTGRGIDCYASSPTIANSVITGNGAEGIYCSASSPTVLNSTIAGNVGGVSCHSSSPMIANTIIAFNSYGVGVRTSGSGGTSATMLSHNCVYGNVAYNYSGITDPTGTNGSISADPRLGGWQYGNWHIRADSPCVDAGDDGAVQMNWLDMDGQSRPQGVHVDIGADESDGTMWPEPPFVIVRVSPDGDDVNDGSSWATAKRTLQAGINVASAAGGEVWVKAGTYPERITLRTYAHVYGGFGGAETARDQRDFRSNMTILDGQQGGSVVTAQSAGYGLSTIDGFVIRNGTGTASGSLTAGGGVYCSSSSPIIANNTITENITTRGGGVFCSSSSPTIVNNVITGNVAVSGGGICCSRSFPTIANNTIAANAASSYGGGIYCDSSYPTIENTIIAFNSSGICQRSIVPGVPGTTSLSSNCVYGNTTYNYFGLTDSTGTNGNISADPLFVNRGAGDFHLMAASPCINAGDPASDYAGQTDIDGDPRVAYGRVDIGADEFLYRGPLDFDLDNDVDVKDFGFFAACFAGSNRPYPNVALCGQADFDADADVDLRDFGTFRNCFNGPNRPPKCL